MGGQRPTDSTLARVIGAVHHDQTEHFEPGATPQVRLPLNLVYRYGGRHTGMTSGNIPARGTIRPQVAGDKLYTETPVANSQVNPIIILLHNELGG